MTAWWDGPMYGFDLETTSPEPEEARIVSFAIVNVGPSKTDAGLMRDVEAITELVDPGVEIPEEATAVHGISTEQARQDGMAIESALAIIMGELAKCIGLRLPLADFNARFDLTVLDRELRRRGYVASGADLLPQALVVDPLVIDKHTDRYRSGKRTLEVMCEHYVANIDGAHRAEHDALAAIRLAWRIGKAGQVIRRVRNHEEARELAHLRDEWEQVRGDLGLLQAAQRRWAAFQAEGLEDYFRRGNPAKDLPPDPMAHVAREWPILPITPVSSVAR